MWNFLKHTARWDSIFFIEISHFGYVVEKNHAFFPLYSYILRFFSAPFVEIFGCNWVLTTLVMNFSLSLIIFCTSALLIYRVGKILMNCHTRSMIAALLFAINPCASHFLAVYTENLYTFLMILCCYVFYNNFRH